MTNSTLLTDYVQRGTFAARPASPATPGSIASNAMAFYYATDTAVLYSWTGAAWVVVGSGTGGTAAAPEWNAQDARMADVNLHPDGVTITGLYCGSIPGAIRAGASHIAASGKFYFEFLVRTVSGFSPDIGVGTAAASLTAFVGSDAFGWGMLMDGRSFTGGASSVQNTYAATDVVGVAVDFTAATGSIKFFKNNAAQLVAYTGLTLGTMFPMSSWLGDTGSASGTLRLKASEQSFAPPAGYSAWS